MEWTSSLRTFGLFCVGISLFGQSAPATPEDLIRQVLTATEAKDKAALQTLTIDEAEYRKYVWPNVAATSNGGSAQNQWGMYRKTSEVGINTNLAEFGGRKLELVKLSFGAPIKEAKSYRLLSAPTIVVKDERGQENSIRLAGSILEHEGRLKIANYFVRPTGR